MKASSALPAKARGFFAAAPATSALAQATGTRFRKQRLQPANKKMKQNYESEKT
jgi:hypothetical protein